MIKLSLDEFTKKHHKQKDFLTCDKRWSAIVAGTRGGKTTAGALKVIIHLLQKKNQIGWVVAPIYKLFHQPKRKIFNLLEKIKTQYQGLEYDYKKQENIVYFPYLQSELHFLSADRPETLVSIPISFFWLDEARLVSRTTWDFLTVRTSDQSGSGWLTTTPQGYNWIWQLFINPLTKLSDSEYFMWQTINNPHFQTPKGRKEIEDARDRYTDEFYRQEYEAAFVTFAGLVYKEFNRVLHLNEGNGIIFTEVVAGVDWGYRNPAVVLVVGITYDGVKYVIDEFYQSGVLLNDLVGVAKDFQKRYNIAMWYCGADEPGSIDAFRQAGLSAIAANNEVGEGIEIVRRHLKSNSLFISSNCVNTVRELETYRYPELKSELKEVRENPLKVDDHAMDTLRYVLASLPDAGMLDKSMVLLQDYEAERIGSISREIMEGI